MSGKRILIVANSAWNLMNFRREVITALINEGYSLETIISKSEDGASLEKIGVKVNYVRSSFRNKNTLNLIFLFVQLLICLLKRRPNLILSFTLLPNIYLSILSRILKIRIINNITGFGSFLGKNNKYSTVIIRLYQLALQQSNVIFFQNETDRNEFVSMKICSLKQAIILPGSGVNFNIFSYTGIQNECGIVFMMASRLIRDKGVLEYLSASKKLRTKYPFTNCKLFGDFDFGNPSAIGSEAFEIALNSSGVTYFPFTSDIASEIGQCDVAVLPSYREGLSRFLLEAGASGKIIIATDVPGCRELIVEGKNGYLCKPGSAESLFKAMEKVMLSRHSDRDKMCNASRELVKKKYDVRIVVEEYLRQVKILDSER